MKNIAINFTKLKALALITIGMLSLQACDKDDLADSFEYSELALTVSNTNLVMDPSMYNNSFKFEWTRGNNQGTGSSMEYILQIDAAGNEFAAPLEYEFGKTNSSFSIAIPSLNEILLNTFGATAGQPFEMEGRIIARVSNGNLPDQIANRSFTLTPYKPLSSQLFIVGSATPNGWNIGDATELTRSTSNPNVFVYNGALSPGNFKFAVSRESCWCQSFYTKDANNDAVVVFNEEGSGDDHQWEITEGGMYKVTVNILDLTISIIEATEPPFNQLWVIGDATSAGWDINNPLMMTASSNPFIYTFEAQLNPGEFKIGAGATGDFCGNWFMPAVENQDLALNDLIQTSGCDIDNKWKITAATAGRYKITVNMTNTTVKIEPVEVYIIGDATINGWNMGSLVPMQKNGSVYTMTTTLGAGEMKFVKFNSGWCQGTEIVALTPNQSISNTNFTTNENCEGADNKWKVIAAEAGTYTITLDLNTNTLTIQ